MSWGSPSLVPLTRSLVGLQPKHMGAFDPTSEQGWHLQALMVSRVALGLMSDIPQASVPPLDPTSPSSFAR